MKNQIKEKNEELKEINYELDKFVNRTSHDLKAPLISVLKIIDAAEDEKDVAKLHTYFLMQKKTLNRISNLVKDIINFSKNKRLKLDLGEIDFTELVNRALEDHATALSAENIKKQVNIKQYEKFTSDSRRVSVIIDNLILNASINADATKSNQTITIEV